MPVSPKHRGEAVSKVDSRESAHRRGYDKQWKKLRADILKRDGFRCQRCGEYGNASFHVDHIKPFGAVDDPLRLDESNLQVLCPSCHSTKTAKEDGYRSQRHG